MSEDRVCVIGLWHLGSVVSACLADLGYTVVGVDGDPLKIEGLSKGVPPVFEPGLPEIVAHNLRKGRLTFTTNVEQAVTGCQYVLITLDTPVNDKDDVDLTEVFSCIDTISDYLENDVLLFINSQLPVGTSDEITEIIKRRNPKLSFDIVYSPENLRLGQAIERFKNPDRIVIGGSEQALDKAEKLLSVVKAPKLRMGIRSAEMSKHAINAFLGTSVSFINEIANLCDEIGADALKVSDALRSDERIGNKLPLRPGLGFSGGTLARDLKVLQGLGRKKHYKTHLINGVLSVNQAQNVNVERQLQKYFGNLSDLDVGVLGLTYKPGTSTLRRSPAIEIIRGLAEKGVNVRCSDPKADVEEVKKYKDINFSRDPYEVAAGCDALVIVTGWPEYKELDYDIISASMKKPVILDTQNLLNSDKLIEKGFIYFGTGRGGFHYRGTDIDAKR